VNKPQFFNGFIYADHKWRRAAITNTNLNDFRQWEVIATGNWVSVAAFDSLLIAVNNLALFRTMLLLILVFRFSTLPQPLNARIVGI
jgi:hypothetical protein